MPRRAATVLILFGAMACGSPAAGRKVLLIGIDGVRVDKLYQATTPTIDSLIATGLFVSTARTTTPSVSGPAWSSMLAGVWPAKHRVTSNDFHGNAYDRYPDFLTRLEQTDPAYGTYAAVDWPPLGRARDGGPFLSSWIDRIDFFDGDSLGYRVADSLSVATAADYLATHDVDAAFVYIGNVDELSHEQATVGPAYLAEIARADGYVAQLLHALARRPHYDREDWLVLLSTDHGRTDQGDHGGDSPEEMTIFVLASGPDVTASTVARQVHIVDVAATALRHFRLPLIRGWGLDGTPLPLAAAK